MPPSRPPPRTSRGHSTTALPVGEAAGLPLTRFPLERTAEAHDAVEAGAVGKVLIDVAPEGAGVSS